MRLAIISLLAVMSLPVPGFAQAPTFKISTADSTIRFSVKASVPIDGTFDRWNATMKFASTDPTTGVLDIRIQASSVDTGSGMKNGKLKSADFFNAQNDPLITFRSTKVTQTGPESFDVAGNFTIRGVTKPETLKLTASGNGTGVGAINGTMAFDRREYGMTKGIPFLRIADRVEVTVDLKVRRESGPALIFKGVGR